jgi:REP element-mobilizing transposase RayT
MPGTFSQIFIQVVFAVKGRETLLSADWRVDVFRYMAGIIREKEQKPIIVNGVSDHVHLLVGLRPAMSLAALVRDVKNNSSNFINQKKWVRGKFAWQEGYGAFSHSQRELDAVYKYIQNQEEHHRKKSFKAEYHVLLKRFNIEYQERYLFDWIE